MAFKDAIVLGFSGDRSVSASGYSDLILSTSYREIMLFSFAGKPGDVQTVRAIFSSKNQDHLRRASVTCYDSIHAQSQQYNSGYRRGIYYRLSPRGYRVTVTRLGQQMHLLAVTLMAFTEMAPFVLIGPPGGLDEALARYLKQHTPIPFLPEWVPAIRQAIERRLWLYPLQANGSEEMCRRYQGWFVNASHDGLQSVVTELLNTGQISIGDLDPNAEPIADESRQQLTSYVRQYRKELADIITRHYTPLFNPQTDKVHPAILESKKELLVAQQHAVQGVLEVWKRSNWAMIVGEMGTGKGVMAPVAAYAASKAISADANGKPYRALVVCPGHLVHKWEREVQATVPNARVTILRDFKELVKIDPTKRPEVPEYFILSRSRAKLGYMERRGTMFFERRGAHRCPDCGVYLPDRWNMESKSQRNTKCPNCGTKLWQADNTRVRRYPMADWIAKRMKGWLDYVIIDEIHEDKAGTSEQGMAMGKLAGAAKKVLGLTGTLLGGYAEDLFYILFRLAPHKMRALGFGHGSVSAFVERYGVVERVSRRPQVRGGRARMQARRLPGVSPMIFPDFLMDNTVFLSLSDLGYDLPPYEEIVSLIEMDEEQRSAYREVERALRSALAGNLRNGVRSRASLGTYISAVLAYPDHPYIERPITELDEKTGEERIVYVPPVLSADVVRPKEAELVWHVQEELAQGRKVWVYVHYTGGYKALDRIEQLLKNAGIKVAVLQSSHPKQEEREAWIQKQVADGVQVIISHPKLVATGLDLYEFPTIIFYQTGTSVYQLRQASRRSWRIGQTRPVKVIFMAYKNTLQEDLLRLMGSKLEAATAIEGKFSEDGLRALADSEDMTSMLARALVEGLQGVDSAESIWKRLNEASRQQRSAAKPQIKVRTLGDLLQVGLIKASSKTRKMPEGQLFFDFFEEEPATRAVG